MSSINRDSVDGGVGDGDGGGGNLSRITEHGLISVGGRGGDGDGNSLAKMEGAGRTVSCTRSEKRTRGIRPLSGSVGASSSDSLLYCESVSYSPGSKLERSSLIISRAGGDGFDTRSIVSTDDSRSTVSIDEARFTVSTDAQWF